MGVYKSYKRRFQLKNCNEVRLEKQEKHKNDKMINEIKQCLAEMDQNQLEIILNTIRNQSLNSTIGGNNQRANLILTIQQLPEEQLLSVSHLISTMRYPKGPNKGKIYSPYLQKKAYESITQTLYKHQPTYRSLQESNAKLETDFKKLHQKIKL